MCILVLLIVMYIHLLLDGNRFYHVYNQKTNVNVKKISTYQSLNCHSIALVFM